MKALCVSTTQGSPLVSTGTLGGPAPPLLAGRLFFSLALQVVFMYDVPKKGELLENDFPIQT
jgi:hypothetical protein